MQNLVSFTFHVLVGRSNSQKKKQVLKATTEEKYQIYF